MAAQTQKPLEFVSRNEEELDDDVDSDDVDNDDSAVIIVMVFAKTAGIRECLCRTTRRRRLYTGPVSWRGDITVSSVFTHFILLLMNDHSIYRVSQNTLCLGNPKKYALKYSYLYIWLVW